MIFPNWHEKPSTLPKNSTTWAKPTVPISWRSRLRQSAPRLISSERRTTGSGRGGTLAAMVGNPELAPARLAEIPEEELATLNEVQLLETLLSRKS